MFCLCITLCGCGILDSLSYTVHVVPYFRSHKLEHEYQPAILEQAFGDAHHSGTFPGEGSHIDMVYIYVPAFWGAICKFWYSDPGVFIADEGAQLGVC